MAGDWLKFETATLDKPEVWAIAQDLSIDPDAVIGKLLRVWSWFDQQSTIGNAPSVTKALLDRCAGVTGFCDSVIKAGWMVDDGRFLSLPNFDRHNGNTAKSRALTSKRVKKHRSSDDSECNAPSVTKALPEKRREENITTKDIVIATAQTSKPTGMRLPNDWKLPQELGNWALDQGLTKQQVILEGEKFRDHWIAQAGSKGRKADWPATWRNWIRNSKSRQPKTFYEITKEQKEADADKRLTAIGNATMAELEEAGLARNGVILGGSSHG